MSADPQVSVIIPAYNAQETIAQAIEAVLAQDFIQPFELIIVDDGSLDPTPGIIARYPAVRYIRQENAGPASARNHGAREARGRVLIFTDADCCPGPSWITKLMRGFLHNGVGVVAGSYGIANPRSLLARLIHAEIMFRHHKLMPEYIRAFGSYNFAISKKLFMEVGGFNDRYRRASGEDNDLSYKIVARGELIYFCKDATVDHYHQEDLLGYLREQYRHGVWRMVMYRDHPHMAAGDGYTFWKDIIEVPLAGAHLLTVFMPAAAVPLFFGFFTFQFFFGRLIMCSWIEAFACAGMMWLRSFARAAGAISGGVLLFKTMLTDVKKK